MNKMERDAALMEYEEWDEKYGDELWAIYHEEGVNYDYDVNYEDWCEKKYISMRELTTIF